LRPSALLGSRTRVDHASPTQSATRPDQSRGPDAWAEPLALADSTTAERIGLAPADARPSRETDDRERRDRVVSLWLASEGGTRDGNR